MTADRVEKPTDPPLAGRDQALAELDGEIERALGGDLRVVLITGAAGLGKTRLATESLLRFSERAACLDARAWRWGEATSFGPWLEALDRYLRHPDRHQVQQHHHTVLTRLLTPADDDGETTRRAPQRHEFLDGLVEAFHELCARSPVLVTLDDMHLADQSSWEALRYLARRLANMPIGLIVTARPGELQQHPVANEALVGLEEDDRLHRLVLQPLGRADATRLAHDVLRGEAAGSAFVLEPLVTWLMERTSGHPLYIIGLLRALVREGADPVAPRLARIPENLQERIHRDVLALDTTSRTVLDTLAVIEHRVNVDDLVAITGLPPETLADALETLHAARLVDEWPDATGLASEITHPVIADAIYQRMGAARRRLLHRNIARTLLRVGRLGSAAGHYARAAEPGDDEAIDALCDAMRQAEGRGLYREALAVLATLLDILPEDDSRWLRVLRNMGWQSEWVLSHLAENDSAVAVAAMRRIERHVPAEDTVGRATIHLHLAAFLSFGTGEMDAAEQACRIAVKAFDAAGDPERTLLARNELAWLRGSSNLDEQADLAGTVLDDALHAGHSRAAVHAAGTRAYALGLGGRFDEAERQYDQAIELARHNDMSYRAAWALSQRGVMLALAGQLTAATDSIEAALSADPLATDALALENLAYCYWLAGHLVNAASAVERAAVRRPMRGSRRRAWAAALAARVHAEQGLRGRADGGLELARSTYGDSHLLTWSAWTDWTAGFLLWRDGAAEPALSHLARSAARLRGIGAEPCEALVLADAARIAAETGNADAATAAADCLEAITRRTGGRLLPGLSRLARAWSELAAQRPQSAASIAERAVMDFETAGYHLYRASALELQGRAAEQLDRGQAIRAYSAAAEGFDKCGAVLYRESVRTRLDRLGSRGRRAAAVHGPAALTSREREVAALAAHGLTAREIGERLFIGRRTVETHLASAYRKLGVASKRELVRRADEFELTGTVP